MIARMIEAVQMFAPLGTPENNLSIHEPGVAFMISGSWTCCAKNGANTNRPHLP